MLTKQAHAILNDPALISYRDGWFQTLSGLFERGEPRTLKAWGIQGRASDGGLLYREPEVWMDEVLENLAARVEETRCDSCFVPMCVWGDIYGVHFIDKLLGAEVFASYGQWYNRYLKHPVGELKRPDLDSHETWIYAKRIAEAFLAADVTVPLFTPPILSSPLNIAVNLYGQEMLVAMMEEPEAAKHDLQIIYDVIAETHQWYIDHIPTPQLQPVCPTDRTQPPAYGQICGCTTQLLSPALYEEFILPLDNALLGLYPHGGMIHLCGSHSQLIPLFAKMENLKSVQVNDRAAEDLEHYVQGLREDQVIYLHPCPGMPVERGMKIAKDHRMVVSHIR